MRLFEIILCGAIAYAGVAGFVWFFQKAYNTAPLTAEGWRPNPRDVQFDSLTSEGKRSVGYAMLSLLVMMAGTAMLFAVLTTIPLPPQGAGGSSTEATTTAAATRFP